MNAHMPMRSPSGDARTRGLAPVERHGGAARTLDKPGSKRITGVARVLMLLAAGLLHPLAHASDAAEAQALVEKARITVQTFSQDPDMAPMKAGLRLAKAVLVFPQVLRAGFVIGGSGGSGVLLVRDPATGQWQGPAFYTLAAASFGLQAGASSAEMVMLVNNQKSLDSLYVSKLKLGGDVSVALGPKGIEKSAAVSADFVVFSKVKGLYAGVAVDGAVLDVRESLNAVYYGDPVTPVDILVRKAVSRPESRALQAELAAAAP